MSPTILLSLPTRVGVSTVLGYFSIGFWLCAQLPQVMTNIRLASCDGLALPFLVNWLFGDITNLIGCMLTDQLPFQTWLAAYFCVVDFALLCQFFHYRNLILPPPASPAQAEPYTFNSATYQSLILPSPHRRTRSSHVRSLSHPPLAGPSYTASPTARPRVKRKQYSYLSSATTEYFPDMTITSPRPEGSYAAIYEAAMDVARAAESASTSARSRSTQRNLSRQTQGHQQDLRHGMTDSFLSEMSALTSKSVEELERKRMSQSLGTLMDDRGRTRERIGDTVLALPTVQGDGGREMREQRIKSRSASLVRGGGTRGRRAAGVAFMSLGLVVGFGQLHTGGPKEIGRRGLLRAAEGVTDARITARLIGNWSATRKGGRILEPASPLGAASTMPLRHPNPVFVAPALLAFTTHVFADQTHPSPPSPPAEVPSFQRFVGRVSAWSCTTLYLTSRLPQIWKNSQRKSVEGLSILLFLFAFCGNLFYVVSILLNPAGSADPKKAGHYLFEALPYLIGSGGTLIFDLTIMLQSVIYGSSPPVAQHPIEHSSFRRQGVRRRVRHLEDGRNVSLLSERQLLLTDSMNDTPHSRRGSFVPEEAMRTSRGLSKTLTMTPEIIHEMSGEGQGM